MIVDPDFLDHWKTAKLTETLNDPLAPIYVIRLWGHCQQRKAWIFKGMTCHTLSSICRWKGDPEQFIEAMKACGFIICKRSTVTVHDWEIQNKSLVTAWENGRFGGLGGRAQKDNPKATRRLPAGNPIDQTRLDQIEKKEQIEQTEKKEGMQGEGNGSIGEGFSISHSGAVLVSGATFKDVGYSNGEMLKHACTGNKRGTVNAADIFDAIMSISSDHAAVICEEVNSMRLSGKTDVGYLVGVMRKKLNVQGKPQRGKSPYHSVQ